MELPQADAEPLPQEADDPVVVSVNAGGDWFIDVGEGKNDPVDADTSCGPGGDGASAQAEDADHGEGRPQRRLRKSHRGHGDDPGGRGVQRRVDYRGARTLMFQVVKRNPRAAVIAVLMHLVIIAFLVVGVDWLEKPKQPKSGVEVIQARVVDREELKALNKEDEKLAEQKRQAELEKKRKAQEQEQIRKQKQQEAEREKKRQAEAKAKKAAKEKARKEAEAKRVAQEKKRKAAAKRKSSRRKRPKSWRRKRSARPRRQRDWRRRRNARRLKPGRRKQPRKKRVRKRRPSVRLKRSGAGNWRPGVRPRSMHARPTGIWCRFSRRSTAAG